MAQTLPKHIFSFLASLAAAIFPPAVIAQPSHPLAPVAWLAGCWSAEGGEAGSGEYWLPPSGETMLGVSRKVKNGKTIEFEFMQLRLNDEGGIVLIALPSGQKETTFPMLNSKKNTIIFENPKHDFPQKIIYRLHSNSDMTGRIEGMLNGKFRGIDFPMKRISCATLDASSHN